MVFVTGGPAAGKSTTAAVVAGRTRLPLVSRDTVKASIVRTAAPSPGDLRRGGPVAVQAFVAFEAIVLAHVDHGVSVVVEQAAERGRAEPFVAAVAERARVLFLHVAVSPATSVERFAARIADPGRRNATDHEILVGLRDGSIDHDRFGPLDVDHPIVVLDGEAPDGWAAVHDAAVAAVEPHLA